MFSHKYRYFFIAVLAVGTYLCTLLCEVYTYFNIEIEWYVAFLTIVTITAGVWEGNRLIAPLFTHKFSSADKNRIKNLFLFFIAGTILSGIITGTVVFFISKVLHNFTFEQIWIPLKLNFIYASLANVLFHLLNAVVFYFFEYRNKWMETEELKRVSAQAELETLKSQINPHFLFNYLNVLSALIMTNTEEANKFIEEFSKVYRYILSSCKKELVSVKAELEFIQPYIFLLEKRFASTLTVTVDVPKGFDDFYIIPASLQMLIENAIKHNVASKVKPLHINVRANGGDAIEVTNNLQLREGDTPSTKIGLSNISKRYWLTSGRAVTINKDQNIFSVVIPVLSLN